jgi:hypothetical protein
VERDRRLEKLAIDVLTAFAERDATVAVSEQGASAAVQAMIADEFSTVSRLCNGAPGQSATAMRSGVAI